MTASRRPWLLPLVPFYAGGVWLKNMLLDRGWRTPQHAGALVVSVGSLSAGGAGKTPLVILLAGMLREAGFSVDVLSRGYGRRGRGVEQVNPNGAAARFGDEPLLLARTLNLPVWVGADRTAAARAAEAASPAANATPRTLVHLLDDGFQHRRLARILDIVLWTRQDAHDRLLPAGNLRESRAALRRAHLIVLREEEAAELRPFLPPGKPIWIVRRRIHLPAPVPTRPLVFCGIARPQGFLDMLAAAGVTSAGVVPFPDHHPYTTRDAQRLLRAANAVAANGFITTEKDAVKLTPDLRTRIESESPLLVASLRVELVEGTLADLPLPWVNPASSGP